MEIRPSPRIKGFYTLVNFLAFLFYCPLPVIVLQVFKRRPEHLYDLWSLVIAIFGVFLVLLIQLYILAYIRTLRYELLSEDLRVEMGIFWKRKKVIPYHKITNLNTLQGPVERRFGLGHLNVQTAGHGANSAPEGRLVGLEDFDGLKEKIMQQVRLVKSEVSTGEGRSAGNSERELLTRILDALTRIEKNTQKS